MWHIVLGGLSFVASIACAVIVACGLHVAWRMFRIPRRVHEEHRLLHEAIRAMNDGTATDRQRDRIYDAEKLGLVNAGFYVQDGGVVLKHYATKKSFETWFDGYYPTTAELDAELAEFRIV